jgi:DNA modification methylase
MLLTYNGDCIETMRQMPENSVDSIVTDPPYELGFMGKSWDASGIAFNVEVWQEALRVLKPGGHLLAFSGSRTYHRMAVAIEDAGFEIRDQIMWVYGSGFPKSLDVSKAIDKRGGSIPSQNEFGRFLQDAKSKTKYTIADINEALGRRTSNLWSHFVGDVQPLLPTYPQYIKLKQILQFDNSWDHLFVDEAEREIVGTKMSGIANAEEGIRHTIGASKAIEVDITTPATAEAKKWQGWGTALKPAHEPIVVARKPLIGTVAENVLTFGTGGLNIDGGRVDAGNEKFTPENSRQTFSNQIYGKGLGLGNPQNSLGRWPANFIHDGSDEVLELFPNSKGGAFPAKRGQAVNTSFASGQETEGGFRAMGDDGSAARFFYCAKANKRDRNEGLDGFEARREHDGRQEGKPNGSNPRNRTNDAKVNHHPTVKPTDLMRYLCRLVTQPNGLVLDPFMGSGSTGKACVYEGFSFIGIDQSAEYVEIANARIQFAKDHLGESE